MRFALVVSMAALLACVANAAPTSGDLRLTVTGDVASSAIAWSGGQYVYGAAGVFDGCSVALEFSPDDNSGTGDTWAPIAGYTLTSGNALAGVQARGVLMRVSASGCGAGADLKVFLLQVRR